MSWADLSPDLIGRISKKLIDLPDFIRFRCVCKNWRSSAPLSDPPPQLPWLLEYLPELKQELRFYSLSTGKTGVIPIEESRQGKAYRGPCCGYLLIPGEPRRRRTDSCQQKIDVNCVILFNPLTNVEISLPSAPSRYIRSLWPVWTGSGPISSRDVAFVDRNPHAPNKIGCRAVYHPGKTELIIMEGYFYTSCYWDGMFFTTDGMEVLVLDGSSEKLLYHTSSMDWCSIRQNYLVELSGVIVRVCWYLAWDDNVEKSIFHIYKLSFRGRSRQPCWVKVRNIGKHILFLDQMNGFSLRSTAGFKGNCIYFFNHQNGTPCRYDIGAGTFERVPCPFKACTWFLPSLL